MKTLKTLSDITRQELERKRRDLNVFLDKRDKLLADKEELKIKLKEEKSMAEKSMEGGFAYPNYAVRIGVEQENINIFVEKINEQIEIMSEEISLSFSELKKYELMLERKEEEEKRKIEKKSQEELDDIGNSAFERKKKSSSTN